MEAMISFSGNTGADVTLSRTRTGDACAKLRVAVTPRVFREGQWGDLETTWWAVECYRALAENVAASIHRGDPVVVIGKTRTRVWVDEDHVEHTRTYVDAQVVAHDLNRGTSAFSRQVRAQGADDPFAQDPATDIDPASDLAVASGTDAAARGGDAGPADEPRQPSRAVARVG